MQEFREKKRFRELLSSRVVLVILIVILFFSIRGTWSLYQKAKEASINRQDVEDRVASLEARERFLSDEIKRLSSDSGIESEIRQRFNVKKEGEEVAVIVPGEEVNLKGEEPTVAASIISWFLSLFKRD